MTRIKATQAIRNAIESEVASARFYEMLAERTPYPAARAFLRQMVATELSHAAEIEGIGRLLLGDAVPQHADRDVSMVETLPDWSGAEAVTLSEGIVLAIAAEQGAAICYSALAAQLPSPAKDVFLRLARTEEQHAASLIAFRDGPYQKQ
jgi:rubrerythrin